MGWIRFSNDPNVSLLVFILKGFSNSKDISSVHASEREKIP